MLTKLLIETTAGKLISEIDPRHRPSVDVLGTAWRYPRLHAVARRHWSLYLSGLADRDQALSGMAAEIRKWTPRWYVDHVDASALAADFYLLEWLSSDGDVQAGQRFAGWLPQLAHYFARQLDLIIGAELGHYERARSDVHREPLASFLRNVTLGDSRVAWPRVRGELGQGQALDLAAEAFAGPGIEYGGEAWAPVATMMGRYLRHELSHAVFVDQCFTLEHNNGSLFDKYFETENLLRILDAQAAGELETLAEHASPEVRHLWHRHRRRRLIEYDPRWLGIDITAYDDPRSPHRPSGTGVALGEAMPGTLGSGSSERMQALLPGGEPEGGSQVRVRRQVFKGTRPGSLQRYREARVTLHTTSGDVDLTLWPLLAPHTVDNFVQLAQGTGRWIDPTTSARGVGPFYDGTVFHRRVPGFLIQGGDRTSTGEGGSGYRIPDEIWPQARFDRPFIVAMANTGPNSTGSQFFITLGPAEHLTGLYTQFGEVTDAASREVVLAIADAEEAPTLRSISAFTSPDRS
ncbi:peptidylprolyl isomerase [Nonomuraea thailandensis]